MDRLRARANRRRRRAARRPRRLATTTLRVSLIISTRQCLVTVLEFKIKPQPSRTWTALGTARFHSEQLDFCPSLWFYRRCVSGQGKTILIQFRTGPDVRGQLSRRQNPEKLYITQSFPNHHLSNVWVSSLLSYRFMRICCEHVLK